MQPPPSIADDRARLAELAELDAVGAQAEPALEELARLAARLLGVPVAAVNVIGEDDQVTLAAVGMAPGERHPREGSICAHAVARPDEPLVVPDLAEDDRFADGPFHVDGVRSYAGVPLRSSEGRGLGTLCVADVEPRRFTDDQLETLAVLSRAVAAQLHLRRENRRLEDLSATDPLTGVANRRALGEHLQREVLRAHRTGAPLAVLMLDLDHFKAFNDAHGHLAGDALLRDVCTAWDGLLRATDLLARYGGEEFTVLLPDTAQDGARVLADRLREAVPLGRTASVGAAVWDPGEGLEELLGRADAALYAAKDAGRDRTVVAV